MNEEQDRGSETRRTSPGRASSRRTWWPGWIWSVPIAALAIGVWLLVRFLTQSGTNITITFTDANGIKPKDTSVVYRGTEVGEVTAVSLTKAGDAVDVTANVNDDRAAKFLVAGTVFWLRGAKPSLGDLSSLGAVLSGPTIVMEPGAGPPATHFEGMPHEPAAPPGHGPPMRVRVSFDGSVGDVSDGDPVKIRGFSVGEVEKTEFHYDRDSGAVATPVTLALYPERFHFEHGADPDALRTAVARLVEEGLRAKLDRDPPVIGAYRVALEMVPGAPPRRLEVVNGLPEIPTAPGGGLESVVDRLKDVPIDQIAQNALDITKHVDQIASSPDLKDSIRQLDASLRRIRETMDEVAPKVDRVVQALNDTAGQLQQTARTADRTLGGAPSQTGVTDTLRELKEAARSVRSLADYLDRHPEALISGRSRE